MTDVRLTPQQAIVVRLLGSVAIEAGANNEYAQTALSSEAFMLGLTFGLEHAELATRVRAMVEGEARLGDGSAVVAAIVRHAVTGDDTLLEALS